MNRVEYMRRLAALLQDIPEEERVSAMRYYNDYFDEAGEENEAQVIEELGSPEKVAAEMKEGLGRTENVGGAFTETGYKEASGGSQSVPGAYGQAEDEKKPWTNKGVKTVLIVLIVLMAAPIAVPVAIALICCIAAFVIAIAAVFAGLVIAAIAIAVAGVAVFISGLLCIIADFPTAMLIMGSGMVCAALGIVATVAAVRLCIIVLPGIIRFVVGLCRKLFHKRKAVD